MDGYVLRDFLGVFSITAYMTGLIVIFMGLGLNLRRLLRVPAVDSDLIFIAFWLGFAIAVGFLQIWHLFFPINRYALGIVALAGFIGLGLNRGPLLSWLRSKTRRESALSILGGALIATAVAMHAAGPPAAYDSGMYHVPAVRWNTHSPVVIGLGNLHDRLAFNASSLLYDSMLEVGPWAGRATHVANALLVFVFLLQIFRSALRARRAGPAGPAGPGDLAPCIFDLILVTPVIGIVVSHDISSFTTDIPPALVMFVVTSGIFRLISAASLQSRRVSHDAVALTSLAVLAVCLKTSFIFAAPCLILVTFGWLLSRQARGTMVQTAKWSAALMVFLVVPWLIHGTLLSGYPLYPSTFGGLAVDWKVPAELANATHTWIVASSRNSVKGGVSWIPEWFTAQMAWYPFDRAPQFKRGLLGVLMPLGITVAAFGLIIAARRQRPKKLHPSMWVGVVCLLAGVFWFCSAPTPRFGFAILWCLAAATAGQLAYLYESPARRLALPAAFALLVAPILFPLPESRLVRTLIDRVVIPPGPDNGLYPYPQPELRQFQTMSGLTLNVPVRDNRCFDAPHPCTPHPAPNLVLTRALEGRPKFLTIGPWQQMNWPNIEGDEFNKIFLKHFRPQSKRE